jgi:hypothetical protein
VSEAEGIFNSSSSNDNTPIFSPSERSKEGKRNKEEEQKRQKEMRSKGGATKRRNTTRRTDSHTQTEQRQNRDRAETETDQSDPRSVDYPVLPHHYNRSLRLYRVSLLVQTHVG